MAKTVFHPNEIKPSNKKVFLDLARKFDPPEEEPEEVVAEPVYEGPTIEDLQREADQWRADFEREKQEKISAANEEADRIIKDAEKAAFEEVRRKTNEAQVTVQQAKDEAAKIEADAKAAAEKIEEDARIAMESEKKAGYDDGFAKGKEDGFKEGSLEVERLIDRLHTIIERVMDRRQEILTETEQQIVDLVLLMTRKVVKVISENQKSVVVANIVQALKKVKGRGNVTIRVNMRDVELASGHIKDFLAAVENVKGISVVEDSSVDKGGCIVETDFGSIDARIMNQLNELEQKVLEISPVRSRSKTASASVQEKL